MVISTPYKVGPVNCYVTTARPITLIDTGTKWDESHRALQTELAELGLEIEDVQRMADLEPGVAWTGHGHEIHAVHKTVRQRLHFHERRAQRILDLIETEERSAYQIAEPLFGRLQGMDSFLALSETIGHLDWLEEQGRIEAVQHDSAIYWKRK